MNGLAPEIRRFRKACNNNNIKILCNKKTNLFFLLLWAVLFCAFISRVAWCVVVKTNLSTNLALRKPTALSGRHDGNYYASKAVDGNRNPALKKGHCYHSSLARNAWWQVDLQSVYLIREVVIANRADSCCCKLDVTLVSISFNRCVCVRACACVRACVCSCIWWQPRTYIWIHTF